MPVNETLAPAGARCATALGRELDAVVVNRLEPDRFAPAEAQRLAGARRRGPPWRSRCTPIARARRQRAQVGRLHRGTGIDPVRLHARPRTARTSGALADELAAGLEVG